MRKPKVGFISITCPTHKEAKNEVGESWVDLENLKKVKASLIGNGLNPVVIEDVLGSFYEFDDVERKFYIENVDVIFLYIST